jgi:lipopolysaccharide transport system permease protein
VGAPILDDLPGAARTGASAGSYLSSRRAGFLVGINELWQSREILLNLVRRDLKIRHRGSFFGMLWSLATPILTVGLYTFIFTVILPTSPAKDTGHIPFAVYFFVGLATWNFFATSLLTCSATIVDSGYVLRKVYFRREVLPLSCVLSAGVTFLFETAVALLATLIFVGVPGWQIVFYPVIAAVIALLAYGLGLILATLTVFFRDVEHFIGILIQLWFWGTPIIYTLALVAHRPTYVDILKANPMTGVVVSMRNIFLLHTQPDWSLLGYDLAFALVGIVVGQLYFTREQRLFSEMI